MPQSIYIAADNIVSPLGFTTAANYVNILGGKSGISANIIASAKPIEVCAAIIPQAAIDEATTNLAQPYTRFEKLLICSVSDALLKAGVDATSVRVGFVVSTTKGNIDMLQQGAYPSINANRIYLANSAKAVTSYFKNPNTPLVISNACISGVLAIVTAARLLRNGQYDYVIVCGGDIINDFTASGFQSFKALSEEPCKPFDKERTGLNLGEGFGTMVLTAKPIAGAIQILGGATSNDANHISGPSRTGSGLKVAINAAIKESELAANHIDTVSAHGTATSYNDEMEAITFDDLGLGQMPTNSLKGYFGHTLGGAGLVESIVSAQCLKNQMLIKTFGFETLGVSRNLNIITETRSQPLFTCLKTASGFGGCNAALILQCP
jgi:3-oxoacyl-[acyl-carrier-protein] synthase-1